LWNLKNKFFLIDVYGGGRVEASERNDILYALLQNYCHEQKRNIVWQRENAESYAGARGKLIGACIAFELDIVETSDYCSVETRKGREILKYNK